jgi:RHS repeat-associated protein
MTTLIDPAASACVMTPAGGVGGIVPTDPLSFPIAQDAYNFSLHYYPGDYTPISATTPVTGVLEAIPGQAAPLYNGNVAAMAVNLPLTSDGTKVYNYHYDQLNRLTNMDAFNGLNTVSHTFSPVQLQDYKEQVVYDPNGNILSYQRNGYQGGGYAMDNLTYNYNHATTNQLSSISDVAGGTYTVDIKDQGTGDHYAYDQIGNLITDGSNSISWTVYGKIATQTGLSGTISYAYDAVSNRIAKTTSGGTTLYVRDAQKNVLATYQRGTSGAFTQLEIDLNGSSRLGMIHAPALPSQTITLTGGAVAYVTSFTRGLKSYELSNHLGNVLATITDKKIAVPSGSNSSLIDYFTADVVTAQDYYPFGMIMPGRSYTAPGGTNYRYGFNGKENDDEVKGVGDQIDYGLRAYDPRIGKFLSVDPLADKYAFYTPYQYAGNDVMRNMDQDGAEPAPAINGKETEGQTEVTHEEWIQGRSDKVYTRYQTWIYHEGGYNGSKPGYMKEGDYFDDVLKPLTKGSFKSEIEFAFSRKGNLNYFSLIDNAAEYIKNNPTYDSWAKWIPIWGAAKQAQLDFSVGKYGWGSFNTAMAISDVFLLKSLLTAPLKGSVNAMAKEYTWWSAWRSFYGREGLAEAGEQLHHWAWQRNGAKSGSGFSWWLKNQPWNLMPMKESRLFGYTGNEIHTLIHGGSIRRGTIIWKGDLLGEALRATYGTPLWFKTTVNYSVEQTADRLR